MPLSPNTVRRPDFFGVGAVAIAAQCTACTARLLMLELHGRGVPGFFRVDNGNVIADRAGVAAVAETLAARRERSGVPRRPRR